MLKQSIIVSNDNDREEDFDTLIYGLYAWILIGVVFTFIMSDPDFVYSTRCAFIFFVTGAVWFVFMLIFYRKEMMESVWTKCNREQLKSIGFVGGFVLLTIVAGIWAVHLFPQTKTIRHRHHVVVPPAI